MNNNKQSSKKFWLLVALLIGPLVFYLLILTGENKFRPLPVLQNNVIDIVSLAPNKKVQFKDKISILCLFGDDLLQHKTNALNLNEKIYKRFNGFENFQFVVLLPKGNEEKAQQLKKELAFNTNINNWNFVFTTKENIQTLFNSLHSNLSLNDKSYIPQAFIIDKDVSLRGRKKDDDFLDGLLYGYDAETVSQIHQKMVDDVKILLAEYRLALKKNKKKDVFKNPYKKRKDTRQNSQEDEK
jgi:hypothetical protein